MFRCLSILITAFIPFIVAAQNVNGIWKGYFTTGFGDSKKYYQYEIQIVTNREHISGVAYSYLNKDFYGKSQLSGSYSESTKKLHANEIKLISFSNANRSDICLMKNTLSYFKSGNKESLEGTFSSVNNGSGSECGSGYLYLERSTHSDFYQEPFLVKGTSKIKTKIKRKPDAMAYRHNLAAIGSKSAKPMEEVQTKIQEGILNGYISKEIPQELDNATSTTTANYEEEPDEPAPVIKTFSNIPNPFQKRKNKLVKTIITHTPAVDISFYDNGEIDDDTITVYHNLIPVITYGRLSHQPIEYGFDASDDNCLQSFIIVADNLGKIPPNSALMVIYTNHERYEVFVESDLKNNGEVRIVYEPPKKK